ncbi:glycosyl transferase [Knoellia sinensis KCTC 19936]|uniref:D-inositol 3-phosphate glycosyltransferase n=1 Tax=Knoellia sinensis KCTC 19936 TaxID=1385520 RepID=A0A0A0J4I7_9MICO|nr:glycosyltransferase family 4 protein [Knoellia sinensis]KGN31659.1 glycosyl transferase [Knoellia sinensis KCTC 19936]
MSAVHVIVPDTVDDPRSPSGGNTYDVQVGTGLRRHGWVVHQYAMAGTWPDADSVARAALGAELAGIPDKGLVVVDGLIASSAPDVLAPEAHRLRIVILVHLPLGVAAAGAVRAREQAALDAARAVVVTSRWTREWLLTNYDLDASRVQVVLPGVAAAAVTAASADGSRLLCVGAVTPIKGQDVLVDALREIVDLEWGCRCVGSLTVEPEFADRLRASVSSTDLGDRVTFPGARVGADLYAVYATADLVVAPSRTETYGLVVTEALARGVPVIGSDVGGLPEALGRAPSGHRPGILVPPEDAESLAAALRRWLTDGALRSDLRRAARERRADLHDWSETADAMSHVLTHVAEVAA